ncbi:hypothetical protein H112_02053 [Trichophyton rubrum D6]|uniref:Uncharacterized protein n=1 Tax=Trichophyton soudanense CBS 452.61 TaxID=1215331 RepID=A0A022Y117_TRISD|nr:hypothetical protein H100_02051 [Trichophyton rubrum MR850]EZF44756.1 hypothetical protein H102_02046 [Trichophyton rubrum CBS 100081]EZF65966.1 hypothetical protein H104_02033 [Trichophyton rubrum CBS 289.86]EZF76600.1 hypothetical protein H105_02065 [Trichophyton soudanense CBS 452.61]EZF98068.1 hypothetical protein H113_02057 [Trichophyton rubrum MR1459]EZG09005.1 hypothetical protein H106_01915 [Trichophyton rubrum CBS 735.88]EZG19618.1 hypothetical protein H107_02119 [Trichophyton rub
MLDKPEYPGVGISWLTFFPFTRVQECEFGNSQEEWPKHLAANNLRNGLLCIGYDISKYRGMYTPKR